MCKNNHDLIIIGAGPAGLTAAIYGARAGLSTAVLERMLPGGYVATISYIENYPGFPEGIKGAELAEKMKTQALRLGVKIIGTEARSLKKINQTIHVRTSGEEYETLAVIIATGTTHKKLGVPGEDRLSGRGVSYCATCDGPLFKGRSVAVVGCGNAGLQEGRFLLNFVKDIIFIESLSYITAEPGLQKLLENESRVKYLLNHEILSIDGDDVVRSITVQNRENNEKKTYQIDGVFIYAGITPLSQIFKEIIKLDNYGFVITNEDLETSIPGVFAAGDIRSKKIRQVVTACAEGAVAALNAYHHIRH